MVFKMRKQNQIRKGGKRFDPEIGFFLYSSMLDLMKKNHTDGKHAGLIGGLCDRKEMGGFEADLEGMRNFSHFESLPALRGNGDYNVGDYLNSISQKKGAFIFSPNGILIKEGVAIESVHRGLPGVQYILDNNARGTTTAFWSHLTNGMIGVLSKEKDRLTFYVNGRVYTTTQDIETVDGLVKGEELNKKQFVERAELPIFAYRPELPVIPSFDGLNYGRYSPVPEGLAAKVIESTEEFANKYDGKLLIVVGDKRLKDILTTPLDGNPVEDYYKGKTPNLIDATIDDIMELETVIARKDGASFVGLDGEIEGAKLFVNGARSYGIRFPDLRTLSAYSVSKGNRRRVLGACIGNEGAQSYLNGRRIDLKHNLGDQFEPQAHVQTLSPLWSLGLGGSNLPSKSYQK